MKPSKVPRSPRVLILIDFIDPLNFPGAEKLAPAALVAARATVRLRERLDARKAAVVYANDNDGAWTSDFQALVAPSGAETTKAKNASLEHMRDVLKCDVRSSRTAAH